MNARKRFEQERPYAARVNSAVEHLGKTAMRPDHAQVAATVTIAHALLDVGDALRDVAEALKGVRRGDDR